MPKFHVTAMIAASKYIGVFDAETAEAAKKMAEDEADCYVNICHQCAKEIEIGEVYDFDMDEIT